MTLSPLGVEFHAALAAARMGTWRWDARTGEVRWDTTLEELSGIAPGTFGGTFDAWSATLHPEDAEAVLAQIDEAIEQSAAYHFDYRVVLPGGAVRWLECRGQVTTDADGAPNGSVGCAVDVTERKEAEHERERALERERQIRDRIQFLSHLTATTLTAADHREFMRTAAATAVPKLGDWCVIHFLPEVGAPIETVFGHSDPEKVAWADTMSQRYPYDPAGATGVAAVIRTGETEFVERVTDEVIDAALACSGVDPDEARAVLEVLGLTSVITAPLRTNRGVLGAMQFVSAESGRVYDADDVALAQVAASRVAEALDNMWLTDRHRHISVSLQQSLLPPALPVVPGVEVAVHYWPAGAAVEVGGDFYDLFALADDRWALLVGDVCGTGPDAAALTGISRHTVRAAARHGQDHRSVLEWLNEALNHSNRGGRFCTAVFATLDAAGDRWRLTSAAGGHPLPIIARPAGTEALGASGTLLGVFDQLDVTVATAELDVGDVVVVYTDGISDVPPPHGLGFAEVADLVATSARAGSAEDVAEEIYRSVTERVPSDQRKDDIALMVLRVSAPPHRSA